MTPEDKNAINVALRYLRSGPASPTGRQCAAAADIIERKLFAEPETSLTVEQLADAQFIGLRIPNDYQQICIALNDHKLAAARRLEKAGWVTIEDSNAGPMVKWAVEPRLFTRPSRDPLDRIATALERLADHHTPKLTPSGDRLSDTIDPFFYDLEGRNEFGQRVCSCGWANHDLRKICRNCGKVLPS